MKFRPWYVLIWAVIVGGIGSFSVFTIGLWDETTLYGTIFHVGVPVIIYLFLRRREKKKGLENS